MNALTNLKPYIMYKQSFGSVAQVQFQDEYQYYEMLGYLAKSDGTSSIAWEHNEDQGAWGSEGRIKFYVQNVPLSANLSLTAGVGNITCRVNCNEFVQNIVTNHGFVMGAAQDKANIRNTIPAQFHADFDRGLGL